MLKKIILLTLAFCLAFVCSEFTIAYCIGYPAYGVQNKVAYRKGGSQWVNIRKPYSKLYNVEGKTLTEVNNYGFPGIDIEDLNNPIVLLGSSYVEAFQYQPQSIASSLFQKKLRAVGETKPIVNLGCSGHDPYDSWFRLKFFEQKLNLKTEDIILVINSDNQAWFARHPQPFDFSLPANFGKIHEGRFMNIVIGVRNLSSMAEVFAKSILKSEDVDPPPQNVKCLENPEQNDHYWLSREMQDCLESFAREYSNFMVISTADDVEFNRALEEYCTGHDIICKINSLGNPRYMIGGAGHLNQAGNIALADALFELWSTR